MPKTLDSSHRSPVALGRRGRIIAILAAAGIVAAGVVTVLTLTGGDGEESPRVLLGPTEHSVTYEVSGSGTIPGLSYTVGDENKTVDLTNVTVPWKSTISLPVGPAGGIAQLSVVNPETGVGSFGCRVFVDGELRQQRASTDGYSGVVCSVQIPPQYAK